MRNQCEAALISCEGAALPFQAHANYGTWSIDFGNKAYVLIWGTKKNISKMIIIFVTLALKQNIIGRKKTIISL